MAGWSALDNRPARLSRLPRQPLTLVTCRAMVRLGDARLLWGRLLRLMCLNVAIGVVLALILWLAQAKGATHSFSDQLIASLIHSIIYGLIFGLAMPYLAERFAVLRLPWNWALIIASLLLLAATATLLIELCLLALRFLPTGDFWTEFTFKSLSVFLIALIISLGIHTYEKVRNRMQALNMQLRTQELEKERALKLATKAGLASLESSLHPHFLFNTLNSISALIAEDPALADKMVQRLASLLRTSLDACRQTQVTLKAEMDMVTAYLEIEKARFRERLSYAIDLQPEMESLPVPPLVLQPIVENSVKYAVLPRPAGGVIKISARLDAGWLVMEVWDNGPGFNTDRLPHGHGLDNLRARLKALLGDEARLSINSSSGSTTIAVYVPQRAAHASLNRAQHSDSL